MNKLTTCNQNKKVQEKNYTNKQIFHSNNE